MHQKRLKKRRVSGVVVPDMPPIVLPEELSFPVEGKPSKSGIYLGIWEPKYKGKIKGLSFDLYAAPTNLKNSLEADLVISFNAAVHNIARLKDWHGHGGTNLHNQDAVYNAVLRDPDILKNWFIPTYGILKRYLLAKDSDMPAESALLGCDVGRHYAYWSCTEPEHGYNEMYCLDFEDKENFSDCIYNSRYLVRPVRAVLRL